MKVPGLALCAVLAVSAATALGQEDPFARLRSENPEERARGREEMAGAPEELLIRALSDSDGAVRTVAAELAGARGDAVGPALRTALRAALRDATAGESPRRAAIRALAACGDAASALEMRALLREFPRDAALGLATLKDTGSLEALRAVSAAGGVDTPPEVGYALAVLGDDAGADLLLVHLAGSKSEWSRDAHHLLRTLTGRDLGPSEALWREAVRLRRLATALGDRDWDASEVALKKALESGPGAMGDLLGILKDLDTGRDARGKAALGLGLLGRREAGPALLEAARPGTDPWVRVYAIEALGRIAWSPAAPFLARQLVHDEDPDVPPAFFSSPLPYHAVASASCRALLEMGCEGAFGVVVDHLSSGRLKLLPEPFAKPYKVRIYHEALSMLRDFGGPDAENGFGFMPDDSFEDRAAAGARALEWWRAHPRNLNVRVRADFSDPGFVTAVQEQIEILGRYKFLEMDRSRRALIILGRFAVPHLLHALGSGDEEDPSAQRRIGVVGVLAEIGDASAAPALRDTLRRASLPTLRARTLVSLARLRPEGGVPEAVTALSDPVLDVRAAAAEALAIHPTPGAAKALWGALDGAGSDADLRILIASALLALRDARAVEPLLAALEHEDPLMRARAWQHLDLRLDGLGPFDPTRREDAGLVRGRWKEQETAPRYSAIAVVPK